MNKITPLSASQALKPGAKNEAKVKATRERLANSTDFSAYNLRWNSLISILNKKNIALICSLSRKISDHPHEKHIFISRRIKVTGLPIMAINRVVWVKKDL